MKQLILFIWVILILTVFNSYTQSHAISIPQMINYSGTLMGQQGKPFEKNRYTLSFKIYTVSKGGAPVWGPKTLNDWPVNNGNFNVILGNDDKNEPIIKAFESGVNAYLEIEADGKTIPPRQQILSTPYAFFAGVTDTYRSVHVMDMQGNMRVSAEALSGGGYLKTIGSNGNDTVRVSSDSIVEVCDTSGITKADMFINAGGGGVNVKNSIGNVQASMFVSPTEDDNYNGTGCIFASGPNGKNNIALTYLTGYPNNGYVSIADAEGNLKVGMLVKDNGAGVIYTLGPNGKLNVALTHTKDYPDNGRIFVADANGTPKAEMYVDSAGQGVVTADIKNSRMANPDQEGTEILYTCIEGPEAAAYIRGTGRLINGRAVVTFPAHFMAVSSTKGITVELTPLSEKSQGLAIVDTGIDGFTVRELFNGNGTYDFDYLAMAVRKGYENYQVIRPVSAISDMQNKKEKIQ